MDGQARAPIASGSAPIVVAGPGVRAYEKAPAVRPGLFDVKKGVD